MCEQASAAARNESLLNLDGGEKGKKYMWSFVRLHRNGVAVETRTFCILVFSISLN